MVCGLLMQWCAWSAGLLLCGMCLLFAKAMSPVPAKICNKVIVQKCCMVLFAAITFGVCLIAPGTDPMFREERQTIVLLACMPGILIKIMAASMLSMAGAISLGLTVAFRVSAAVCGFLVLFALVSVFACTSKLAITSVAEKLNIFVPRIRPFTPFRGRLSILRGLSLLQVRHNSWVS